MTTTPDQTTVLRYRDAQIALLPPGHAFPADFDGDFAKLLEALAVEPARLHEEAARLRVNYDPAQAVELLAEWEVAVGQNRSYIIGDTTTNRQGSLVAKLRGNGSHAKKDFERVALSMGYGEETWSPLFADPFVTNTTLPSLPYAMQSGRWRFTFAPASDSGSLSYQTLFVGVTGNFQIYINSTSAPFAEVHVMVSAGKTIDFLGVSWNAGQNLTLDIDMPAGKATLSGATTGNDTVYSPVGPWTWPSGQLYIGHYYSGTYQFVGALSNAEFWSATGIEFVTYPAFVAGAGAAGDPIYGDAWANVVTMYVPIDNETPLNDDRPLLEAFNNLRRSHGYLDIVLEGPVGSERINTQYYANHPLSASDVVASLGFVTLRYEGHVSIQCVIDNGAGAAPSDTPVGVWELYASGYGGTYTRLTSSAIDAELAKIAPNGNNVVSAFATFTEVPGCFLVLRYNRTSGGGTNAKATVNITTW